MPHVSRKGVRFSISVYSYVYDFYFKSTRASTDESHWAQHEKLFMLYPSILRVRDFFRNVFRLALDLWRVLQRQVRRATENIFIC